MPPGGATGVPTASAAADLVFLLDVDNTLLDMDSVVADLHAHLAQGLGAAAAQRYWAISASLRQVSGEVDYLAALQALGREVDGALPGERAVRQRLLCMAGFLIDYPFADRLYPRALEVLRHLGRYGTTVLLTDGDVVMQPRKLQRAGLWDAVDGRVLVYRHKERMLDAVGQQFPARHYVMVDDKLPILAAVKASWRGRVTTIWPRQGHYALDRTQLDGHAPADLQVEHIGALADADLSALVLREVAAAPAAAGATP